MAKTFKSALTLTVTAAVDVLQHRFAGFDGNYAAAGAPVYGVFQADTASGEAAPVDAIGELVVEAGGVINAGAAVEVGTNGKAVAQTSGAIVGYAVDAAAADGDLIRVLVK
jgi:hypothetical protein